MGFFDSLVSIGKDFGNSIVSVSSQAVNNVVGIGTTVGSGITTFGLSAGAAVSSVTGQVIDWSKTTADEVSDFTLNTCGEVAEFSVDAYDTSVTALKSGWDILKALAMKNMPVLNGDDASGIANTIFAGNASSIASAAASAGMSFVFKFTAGIPLVLYISPAGKWRCTRGGTGDISYSSLSTVSFDVFLVFDSNPSGIGYYELGATLNGNILPGASVLLKSDFNFLGFRAAVSTPDLLMKFFAAPGASATKTPAISMIPLVSPGVIAKEAASYSQLSASASSLYAAGTVAADAKAAGVVSDNTVAATKATALAAQVVGSPMFVKRNIDGTLDSLNPAIAYIDCNGNPCTAQLSGKGFLIAPFGNFSNPVKDRCLLIQNHNGTRQAVTLNIDGNLVLQAGQGFADFQYISSDNKRLCAGLYASYFLHAPNGDFTRSHPDIIISYLAGDSQYIARLERDNTFTHALNGNFSQAHNSALINFMNAAGQNSWAKIDTDNTGNLVFRIGTTPDLNDAVISNQLLYQTWDKAAWTAKLVSSMQPAYTTNNLSPYFNHAPNGDISRSFTDPTIQYLAIDGSKWTAKIDGQAFILAANGDFSQTDPMLVRRDLVINYKAPNSSWYAKIEKDPNTGRIGFRHCQDINFTGPSHYDVYMAYYDWYGTPYSGYIYFPGLS